MLFHGLGADFTDLAPLADFLDPDGEWTWIFPNGPIAVDIGGHMNGRAWFPIAIAELEQAMMTGVPRDYSTNEEKPPTDLMNDLKMFIDEVAEQYEGVVLGGFSQGGMIASHLLHAADDKLLGGLFLSTVLLNQALFEKSIADVKPKRFFQSHGGRDPVLHLKFGQSLYQLLKQKGWKGTWVDFPGGHEIPMPVLLKGRDFLKSLL